MKATRLTLIGLAAIAVIFSGCSKDSRITAPGSEAAQDIDKNQSEYTVQTEIENNAARMAGSNDDSKMEYLTIVAEVFRTEIEGGCFYLTEESGVNYTPVTPKSLSLELGMVLKADGYIDKEIQFFCGNGPAFVIEQYEILWKAESGFEDRDQQKASDVVAATISAQEVTSKKKADEKRAISASDADDKAPARLYENRFHYGSADIRDGSQLTENNISTWPSEDRAPANITEDNAPIGSEDRAPAEVEEEKGPGKIKERYLQLWNGDVSVPAIGSEDRAPFGSEDRAQANASEDRAPFGSEDSAPAESRLDLSQNISPVEVEEEKAAPRKVKEIKLQLGVGDYSAPADATEDRAPFGFEDRATANASEDRAPANITEDNAPIGSEDRAPVQVEEEKGPGKIKERYLQLWDGDVSVPAIGSEDRAPFGSEDRATANDSEDSAPKGDEDKKEADEIVTVLAKPVPIIFNDTESNTDAAMNTIEGYTHRAKGGCQMLTTDNKEVFELQHDMDVLLLDGTYIRVTGYISTLPYITCEEAATVFRAETMQILWGPKEEETPASDEYNATVESDKVEYIEEEGVMHRTEPEGMCWYFETAAGDRYELVFSNPISLQSGMQLKVKALPADVDTFCDSGKPLNVVSWETICEDKL